MDRQSELNIERAAEHIRAASKCLDFVGGANPYFRSRIEAITGTEHISTAMADALLALLDETPIDARQEEAA